MEVRKQQLVSNFHKLEQECASLISLVKNMLQKNSKAVDFVTSLRAVEFSKEKGNFLEIYQNISNDIQKILSINFDLETYFEINNIPTECTMLAIDYQADSSNDLRPTASIKQCIEESKAMAVKNVPIITSPDLTFHVVKPVESEPQKSTSQDILELQKISYNHTKEISEGIVPKCNDLCLLSIFTSPSNFYINVCNEETSIIDLLAMQLTEIGNLSPQKFWTKAEASEKIHKYCMAYLEDWESWYRSEVIDWLDIEKGDMVQIRLIDYGEMKKVRCANLQPLPNSFYQYPRLAVKCHFAFLYPPGSTANNLLTTWPKESSSVMEKPSATKTFRLTFVEKFGDSYGLDMIEASNDSDDSLGQRMINGNLAVEILPGSKGNNNCVNTSFIRQQIETSQGNDGKGFDRAEEEAESLEKALTGYEAQDEKRICKFAKNGSCFKNDCKLEHTELRKDGITTDRRMVFAREVEPLCIPKTGETVDIIITFVLSLNTFYAQLRSDQNSERNLNQLINTMNRIEKERTYKKFDIFPACGEIVLAKYWNNKWYRCFVKSVNSSVESSNAEIQVFFVDFGDEMSVSLSNLRVIPDEFMYLPFQAVKCNIANIKPIKTLTIEWCKKYIEANYLCKLLQAKVMYQGADILEVLIFDSGMNIGEQLARNGLAELQKNPIFPSEDESIFLE